MSNRVNLLTPVGRLVMGSLYKPSTKDADGNPLTFKSGENVGKARVNYFLALAIPKGPETHWSQTEWGALIYQTGKTAFPQAHVSPTFAWKVTDGDDATPNTKGKRACDTEGFPGNWILRFSGSFAPKVYREEGGAYVQVTEENYIKPGYYVQISGTVSGNNSQQRPGLYLNHSMVAFVAYGQEIHFGPDANSVGFGKAPLPAGASASPLASGLPLPTTTTSHVPVPTPSSVGSAGVVTPNPGFLNVPTPPSAPPASTTPKMTAKAAGSSYQAFKTAGWTDEALLAQGYLA
jgi:hypothetical protein